MSKSVLDWFKNEKGKEFIEFLKSIIFALIIALMLRSTVVEANYIFSGSMTPTLLAGDYILVNKLRYGVRLPNPKNMVKLINRFWDENTVYYPSISIANFATPQRSDIITFIYPQDTSKIFVKRVIGIPGDIIEIKDQILYINNQKIKIDPNPYFDNMFLSYNEYVDNNKHTIIHRKMQSLYGNYGPVLVPENNYFVLGDNRDNSADSRFWGFVPVENVLGKALVTYFSNSETLNWNPLLIIDWIKGIRWSRMGTLLVNI